MKNTIVIILILLSSSTFSQDLEGKWYMVNRSGVIEFNVSEDSLTSEKLFVDLMPKRGIESQEKIVGKLTIDSLRIIIIQDGDNYKPMTFISCKEDSLVKLVWNLPDTSFTEIKEIKQYYQSIDKELLGYNLFSKSYKTILEERKTPSTLTQEEFKDFLKNYILKSQNELVESDLFTTGYLGFSTYNHQIITQTLYELNYNPFQTSNSMEMNFRTYKDDPEIKEIIEEWRK